MRIENLFQFIVPLTFLAIWAITSLFNREAQPPPPRAGRPPRPNPWDEQTGPGRPRPNLAETRDPRGLDGGSNDLLVIDGTGRSAPSTAPATRPRRTGGGRGKPSRPAPEPKARPERVRSSRIEGVHAVPTAGGLTPPEALRPLSLGPNLGLKGAGITTPPTDPLPRPTDPITTAFGAPLTPESVRRNLLLAEILFLPPVSLRGKSRGPIRP